ncbi:hypothetical protein ACLB2K_052867 [Fragaria x ananassa]
MPGRQPSLGDSLLWPYRIWNNRENRKTVVKQKTRRIKLKLGNIHSITTCKKVQAEELEAQGIQVRRDKEFKRIVASK